MSEQVKKTSTALLLSGLVLPGAGQFYFKSYLAGLIFSSAALVALYIITVKAVGRGQLIVDKIVSREIPVDLVLILEQIRLQTTQADVLQLNIASMLLVMAWVASMIDTYRLGRKNMSPKI